MTHNTKIEWADATWNPMTGCTPVSPACDHCYAERMAGRNLPVTRCPKCEGGGFTVMGGYCHRCEQCHGTGNVGFTPTFHPDRLDVPLHWRKPRRIFVCSMSDLFHEAFTEEQIDAVFNVFAAAPQHTYMVLTKRPERAKEFVGVVHPNLWLGVTVEDQRRADERIPILLDTPAAVRFISIEPMLGPVNLTMCSIADGRTIDALQSYEAIRRADGVWDNRPVSRPSLDWVILGGETGPGARPMQPEWALDLYRQCKAAGVPFFFKKAKWAPNDGAYLTVDGSTMDVLPELREMVLTREFPEVTP